MDASTKPSVRTRAAHTKSRRGCTSCKRRHLKCDERTPTCERCLQAGTKCERQEVVPRRARRVSGFRAFKMMYTPNRPDDTLSMRDLDFFQHRTLPLLRKFQPSILWDISAPRLVQEGSSFRSVAVALAHQQRLVEDPEAASSGTLKADADRAYSVALSLVRQSIDAQFAHDHVTLAFQCVLLVILESLRGSQSEMIVHLHSGIRIVCESPQDLHQSRDMREIGRTLRQYGISTMLLNPFLPPARETQELMWRSAGFVDDSLPADSGDLGDVSSEVYRLIFETLNMIHRIYYNPGHLGFHFCEEVARLRVRQSQIEEALQHRRHADLETDSHLSAMWTLSEARCLLAKTHINYVWACDENAFYNEIETFRVATDLLDSALSHIAQMEGDKSTLAFSVGLGAISALELIAWRCPDLAIRKQAVQLLEKCPRKEGLWNADERSRLWRGMIETEERLIQGDVLPTVSFERSNTCQTPSTRVSDVS